MTHNPNEQYMRIAIEQATNSVKGGDYPVGAVIVKDDKIICKSETKTGRNCDPTAHAEVLAIREAASLLKTKELAGCVLYTTHEPCPMCAGAALFARVDGIVFGTSVKDSMVYAQENPGWRWKWVDISLAYIVEKSNRKSLIYPGFLKEKCKALFPLVDKLQIPTK
ncbi:MAG TPA: nucleoside deaminase [Candidatus Saccharimonadales bacterium]|jgi:tRNA(Arg) A34 adenosine deaminase TadA|nr:nucleoside deaminase [Candidatus Saccharimonadales bacterium]